MDASGYDLPRILGAVDKSEEAGVYILTWRHGISECVGPDCSALFNDPVLDSVPVHLVSVCCRGWDDIPVSHQIFAFEHAF